MQDHAFIGRQPILDAKQQIIAYDLLFRHSATATVPVEDDLRTSARALMNPAPDMGSQWLLGDKLVFINVSDELLQSEFLLMLDPQHTVLELPVTRAPTEDTLQRLEDLHAQGFLIALDNFVPTVESILVTPISPHTMAVRPIILPSDAEILVQPYDAPEEVLVTVDGQTGTTLGAGHSLTVRRSAHRVTIARFPGTSFFGTLRRKLGWGGLAERDE